MKTKRSNSRADFENNKGILLKSTRSQHEAMGFIIIVALVIIVGVIFLGISMNKPVKETQYKDARVANFLDATSKYTTDCFENQEPLTLDNLKEKCYEAKRCELDNGNEVDSCWLLNDTYYNITMNSWPESQTPYYELKIYYSVLCNDTKPAVPGRYIGDVFIRQGNSSACYNKKTGQTPFVYSSSGGCIITEMVLCEKEE